KMFRDIYVFASHRHHDHFNPEILQWGKDANVTCILSDDIPKGRNMEAVHHLSHDAHARINQLDIRTYRSNDAGIAFLVEHRGRRIFHSGDLNWWHWEGEPDEENLFMEQSYKEEIRKLEGTTIDVAFIPVDPRLGKHRYLSLDHFMDAVKPGKAYPIHFQDSGQVLRAMEKDLAGRWYYDKMGFYKKK
ncbi:MAG: MBL fold metallo-hydrolase, partial [Clostridia bacterium]